MTAAATHRMDHIVSGAAARPPTCIAASRTWQPYLSANASQNVRIEHSSSRDQRIEDNPHHFLIVRVETAHGCPSRWLGRARWRICPTDASGWTSTEGAARISRRVCSRPSGGFRPAG